MEEAGEANTRVSEGQEGWWCTTEFQGNITLNRALSCHQKQFTPMLTNVLEWSQPQQNSFFLCMYYDSMILERPTCRDSMILRPCILWLKSFVLFLNYSPAVCFVTHMTLWRYALFSWPKIADEVDEGCADEDDGQSGDEEGESLRSQSDAEEQEVRVHDM